MVENLFHKTLENALALLWCCCFL